jgi:Vault protein inter-alpha-trypsin domain/von Willebrand factor type A domain
MSYSFHQADVLLETYRIPSGVFFTDNYQYPGISEDHAPRNIFSTFPNARPVVNRQISKPTSSINPFVSPVNAPKILCLPLLDVGINVRVDSTIATTKFMQIFTNISDITIPEAHYTFPMYDGAAVTAFRCYIGDSEVLIGKVLSNEEAMIEYMQAIENLETAALLEEQTPEVFQTMIGNIPPKTSVKIEITYVHKLKADISGQGYLVTIPTSLAPRYGTPPTRYSSSSSVVHTGLAIVIGINSQEPIRQIECRSHPVSIEIGSAGSPLDLLDFDTFYEEASSPRRGETTILNPRQATVRLSDPNTEMNKDFVIFVKTSSAENKITQSQALLSPINIHNHSALMVTIQPSELFSSYEPKMDFKGEIIFIADRSGSMEGKKISGLRDALQVFLKSLPDTCTFNLYSFGSSFRSLWESSMSYSQKTLDEAFQHVSSLSADMGGTELLPALKAVVERRPEYVQSTQIIILTDGQVWNSNDTINFVKTTRSKLGDGIRFFVLGIGDTASHRLVEGISNAGGGFGEVVGISTPDKWQERVIQMLKGALMPTTWNCEIDLGSKFILLDLVQNEFPSDSKNDQGHSKNSDPFEYIQSQQYPSVHHYRQLSIFFLINGGSVAEISSVTITATAGTNREDMIKATLPVVHMVTYDKTLQNLTVKSVLLDLGIRMDQQISESSINDTTSSRNAVLLGKLYSVTSKWTSFVATNQDCSVVHSIDSYNALSCDLHLLSSPNPIQRRHEGNEHIPLSDRARRGILNKTLEHQVSLLSTEKTLSSSTSIRAAWGSSSILGYEMRADKRKSVLLEEIVESQTASGRFKISNNVRETLSRSLPTRTREAIEARITSRNEEPEKEVVDTLMMTTYIETKLDGKKDLLELMVNKAKRSVEPEVAEVDKTVTGSTKIARKRAHERDDNEDESESEGEAELLHK